MVDCKHKRKDTALDACYVKGIAFLEKRPWLKGIAPGKQARYTGAWLRSTGNAVDYDGTNGWAEVVDVAAYCGGALDKEPLLIATLSWPNGITRRVLSSNLEVRK
tara:strand:- start:367 stop:681 length:315 start_codon:yes stop_codon:yes gene_type:complete